MGTDSGFTLFDMTTLSEVYIEPYPGNDYPQQVVPFGSGFLACAYAESWYLWTP
jgi:hypothetical protein